MEFRSLDFLCIVFSYTLCALIFGVNGYDGEQCGKPTQRGVCLPALDCPTAKEAILARKPHKLLRCGFSGLIEIVCCPQSEVDKPTVEVTTTEKGEDAEVRGPTVIRKSLQACDDLSNELPARLSYQILGGEDVSPGEFPHMAAIGYLDFNTNETSWDCGGSLISNQFVLTAAHCVVKQGGEPVKIRLGMVDVTGNSDEKAGQDFDIINSTVHPKYVRRTKANDIALIKLDRAVVHSDFIHPACLYQKENDPFGMLVTGWGQIKVNGPTSTHIMQKAPLIPVDISECNVTYFSSLSRSITTLQICAKSDDGKKDTCQGDSGGPLQIQQRNDSNIFSIVGITSYGRGCGGNTPGVYTRVSSYLDWIESEVWPSRT